MFGGLDRYSATVLQCDYKKLLLKIEIIRKLLNLVNVGGPAGDIIKHCYYIFSFALPRGIRGITFILGILLIQNKSFELN